MEPRTRCIVSLRKTRRMCRDEIYFVRNPNTELIFSTVKLVSLLANQQSSGQVAVSQGQLGAADGNGLVDEPGNRHSRGQRVTVEERAVGTVHIGDGHAQIGAADNPQMDAGN